VVTVGSGSVVTFVVSTRESVAGGCAGGADWRATEAAKRQTRCMW
jgi:hypothetical protein